MCGLAGVLLGKKRRRKTELEEISGVFTELLLLNQSRGKDAAGLAVVRRDSSYSLFKRPGPAATLVQDEKYSEIIHRLDNKSTCILGHTRLKTRGSEANSLNNQPIRCKYCLGTHNGHITNADALFKRYRLPRIAEVDSEILFRLADTSKNIDVFLNRLENAQGAMSAVFTKITSPDTIYIIKGNKPLTLWYHRGYHAVFYSSEQWPLETVFGDDKSVIPLDIRSFTFVLFDVSSLMNYELRSIHFKERREIAWERFEKNSWGEFLSTVRF